MTDSVQTIVAAYSQGDHSAARDALLRLRDASGKDFIEAIINGYEALDQRQEGVTAANFVLFAMGAVSVPEDFFLIVVQRLGEASPEWLRANLFLMYLNGGGASIEVFDKILFYLSANQDAANLIRIYRQAVEAGVAQQLNEMTLFNAATMMMREGLHQEAFDVYASLLPSSPDPGVITRNILVLARTYMLPDAIAFVARTTTEMLDGYSTKRSLAANAVEIEYRGPMDDAALVSAVLTNGFCVVRQGCAQDVVARALRYVSSDMQSDFPADFDDEILGFVAGMFRFDAKRLVREILKYSSELDLKSCVARHVRAGAAQTFTPFHQDVTAFLKAVVNIWAPLTPAGGDYPSMEFVRKRIGRAEQTKITEGDYNLIEIEESYVREKYGDLLYRLESASPGDCVIFLGSTIHRSSNLEAATKDRYNLEVRFS